MRRVRWLIGLMSVVGIALLVISACGGAAPTATPLPPAATRQPNATTVPGQPVATPRPTATSVPPAASAVGREPKRGGTFAMRLNSVNQPWDSYDGSGHFYSIWLQNILSNLVAAQADKPANIRGHLAVSWNLGSDGKEYTFNLRHGVQWHDGQPFTAPDVVSSLNRARNPDNPASTVHKPRLASVVAVEATDDFTVRVTLQQPVPPFLSFLAIPSLLIYPAHIPDVRGAWTARPIGTGGFIFKSFDPGVGYEVVRNPNYFMKDAAARQLPFLDSVKYFIISDRQLTKGAFKSGSLDCLCGYNSDVLVNEIDQIKKDVPDARTVVTPAFSAIAAVLNQRPPLNDERVRQAINLGIDRVLVRDSFLDGRGYYPPSLLLPKDAGGQWALPDQQVLDLPGFRKDKTQDLAEVRRLIAQSGVNVSKVSLRLVSQDKFENLLVLLDSELNKLGFGRSDVAAVTGTAFNNEQLKGTFDITFSELAFSVDDPADGIAQSALTAGPRNYAKFSFPEIDSLFQKQAEELDTVKRRDVIWELQHKIYDRAYLVPYVWQAVAFAERTYVNGYVLARTFSVSSAHRLDEVWLDK